MSGFYKTGKEGKLTACLLAGGPLPKFDGITAPPGPPQAHAQPQPLQAQNSGPIRVPPLTPEKAGQYSSLFEESGAQNGMLSGMAIFCLANQALPTDCECAGETAKQIFERANLPNDVLGRIWNLADREQKGHLGQTEFIIAMHLLASYKNGSMRALPQILPSGLYEAAARRGVARPVTGSRPTSDGVPPSAIPRQFTGTGYPVQAPPVACPQQAPFQQGTPTGDQWAVSPQDKTQFDQIYATVDTQNRGYITGEQAVGFFSNSRLPEDALAQIWDLADINSEGQLNRDEFAVAMYLIKQQRSKRDGRDVLPHTLPSNLIPPSMRRQPIAPQQPTAPVFDNAANISAPKSASEDLFGLDAFSAPSSPPLKSQTRNTGDPAYTATPPRSTSSPVPQPSQQQQSQPQPFPQQSHFKPFVPSSSFGQAMMTPQGTGTSASTASPLVQNRGLPQQQQKQPSAMDDLLGDNDPEVSKRLTNETSELANLSNQVSSLTGQMQEIKTKRGSTEHDLSQAQSQKRDFEARLTQLRSAYELEVREVQALEERLKGSKSETQKLQQDMAMIQGTHEDLLNQHRQISEAFSMDQNENANLKERIRQTNTEISEMKPQLEKMRSDARQQKGLVAINKKQLATNEAELEKEKADLEAAAREHEEATRELEQSKRDLEASSQAVSEVKTQVRSPPAAMTSPAPSTASMNPFFRRSSNATTEKGMSPFQTQGVASPNHNAFDSFFGPSLGSSNPTAGPPPSTSFNNDPPNTHREAPEQSMASTKSQNSSYGPDIPTPSGSPPPLSNFSDSPQNTSEPPAPPQSRQITSSFLPFRPTVERSDSESPSVRANPPASRMGDNSQFEGSTERQTSAAGPSIPESPRQHFAEMAAKPPQVEASRFTPPFSQQTLTASSEGIQLQEAAVPDELAESSGMPSATRDVPGAFPGDETPDSEPSFYRPVTTPYSNSKLDPRVDSKPRGGFEASGKEASNTTSDSVPAGNDPFAMAGDNPRAPPATKDDFESAFSGFGDKGKAPEQRDTSIMTNGFESADAPKSHGEFPPIQEFGAEDESDSDEDRGFGDNFTAHSANRTAESGPNQALQAPPVSDGFGRAPTLPLFGTTDTNSSPLPTPGAQTSPPTYDQTVGSSLDGAGHRKESNQFPAEYSGLLPSRVDPTLSTTSPPPQPAVASPVASTAGIDRGLNFFGEDTTEQAAGHATIGSSFSHEHSPMSPGASTAAPYAYTHTSSPQQQQSQTTYPPVPAKAPIHDDFDDEFGDLSEAKEASEKGDDDLTSSRHNDFEDFNPTFDSPPASRHTAQSSSTFPTSDSFADFESSVTGVGSSSRQQQGVQQQTPSHDWDAIFSGLDTPQNNGVQGGHSNEFPSPPREQSGKAAEMRAVKRTMTEDTTMDDPILKELTGMGYSRGESLQALERYDYNLDKVR